MLIQAVKSRHPVSHSEVNRERLWREREIERERGRDRERDRERDTERERETERDGERERSSLAASNMVWLQFR